MDTFIVLWLRREVWPKVKAATARIDRAVLRVCRGLEVFGSLISTTWTGMAFMVLLAVFILAGSLLHLLPSKLILEVSFIGVALVFIGDYSRIKRLTRVFSHNPARIEKEIEYPFLVQCAILLTFALGAALLQFFSWIALSA